MRLSLDVASVLPVLLGYVWFLQGISVLPRSFMTGQLRWAVYWVSQQAWVESCWVQLLKCTAQQHTRADPCSENVDDTRLTKLYPKHR